MSIDPLDEIVNMGIVCEFYQEGYLNDNAFYEAKKVLRPASSWYTWVNRMLLFLGSALVLAGIIFFFAYNWSKMERFFKFGLIEFGIISCIAISYYLGISRISSKILVLSASVLVGTLLAVYGQIYQTGADAFELFRGWALLIFGWVIISEFSALWFLWLVIVNTSVILFWKQVGQPTYSIRYEWLCLSVASLNCLALVFKELGLKYGMEWLKEKWFDTILLTAVLVSLSLPTIDLIVDTRDSNSVTVFAFVIWIIAVSSGYLFYRHKLRDMIPIATIVVNICVVFLTFIWKNLLHGNMGAGVALLFALIILGVVSSAAFLLRKVNAAMIIETKEGNL